jgi:hypothetical protein
MGLVMAMSMAVLVTMFRRGVRFVQVHPLYSTSFAREVQPLGSLRYWEV